MARLSLALLAIVTVLPIVCAAATSKEILLAERSGKERDVQVDKRDDGLNIEICSSACDMFAARRVKSEDEVWDVVLLHQAYFDDGAAAKSFRARNAGHLSAVMAAYAQKCGKFPQDATRATCIIKYLAKRNRIDYATVRYDSDFRCEVAGDLLTATPPSGKAKCERVHRTAK